MAKLSNVSRARARTVRKGNARGSLTRTKRGTYMGLIKKKRKQVRFFDERSAR